MNPLSTALIIRHEPTHDEIALCAFLIWEQEGRLPGREQSYWLLAEAQLRLTRQRFSERATKTTRVWPPSAAAPKLAPARAATTSAVSKAAQPAKVIAKVKPKRNAKGSDRERNGPARR